MADPAPRTKRPDYSQPRFAVLRVRVFRRDRFTCVTCGWHPFVVPLDYSGFYTVPAVGELTWARDHAEFDCDRYLTVDHRRPVIRGGTNNIRNLQTMCSACNVAKGAVSMRKWRALTAAEACHA